MSVRHDGGMSVFEFKMDDTAEAALAQIKRKGYAEKHRGAGGDVHLVGVAFSEEERNVAGFAVERCG